MKLKIGLTGGIASGKSLASRYFAEFAIDIIDADKIARDLFTANSPHLMTLKEHFGDSIFDNNQELIRKKLGEIVFSDPLELKWLNEFTHPLVNLQMLSEIEKTQSNYVILDIPLLIDKQGNIPPHLKPLIDKILVIDTSVESQLERIIQRDKIDKEQAQKIINSQSSRQQKLSQADYVIENNETITELKTKVSNLHSVLLNLSVKSLNA